MPSVEQRIEVEAPIEVVFEFELDPDNISRTSPHLDEIEVVSETDDGYRATIKSSIVSVPQEGELEIRVLEPNEHIVSHLELSGLSSESHAHYSETETGTEIFQQTEFELGDSLLESVVEPVAIAYCKNMFKNYLEMKKAIIEGENDSTPR